MKDPYDLKKAQKEKMSSSLQEEIDEEIIREAKRTEAKNYEKSKAAREKLEAAALKQKETTEEMRRQGESIKKAKGAALNVHTNANKAEITADKIEHESHMFNFSFPFVARIKKWWTTNTKQEKEVEEIKNRNDEPIESEVYSEEQELDEEDDDEYIPGQHKTDRELYKILSAAKKVNKEASVQSRLAEKQKTDLDDINKVNEFSKRKVEKTEKNLKKGL